MRQLKPINVGYRELIRDNRGMKALCAGGLSVHGYKEFLVAFGAFHLVQKEFHGFL